MLAILDTDHLSVLQECNQPDCNRLEMRLAAHPPDQVAVSIVSFHEQVQGWLAWINRAKKDDQILRGYLKLQRLLIEFNRMNVLPLVRASQEKFLELVKLRLRIGTLDLRIAAIALTSQATLLTRNSRDFSKVPGLRIDDWTR